MFTDIKFSILKIIIKIMKMINHHGHVKMGQDINHHLPCHYQTGAATGGHRDDDYDGDDEVGDGHHHHFVNIDHFSNHHQHRHYETAAAAAEGL